MNLDFNFSASEQSFEPEFNNLQTASDGGFERGYAAGYEDGMAARTYETWTFTLVDETVVEKDVALL